MSAITTPRAKVLGKTPPVRGQAPRPCLYKVILNDDFTPREFVVTVLKKVFRFVCRKTMVQGDSHQGTVFQAHRGARSAR